MGESLVVDETSRPSLEEGERHELQAELRQCERRQEGKHVMAKPLTVRAMEAEKWAVPGSAEMKAKQGLLQKVAARENSGRS